MSTGTSLLSRSSNAVGLSLSMDCISQSSRFPFPSRNRLHLARDCLFNFFILLYNQIVHSERNLPKSELAFFSITWSLTSDGDNSQGCANKSKKNTSYPTSSSCWHDVTVADGSHGRGRKEQGTTGRPHFLSLLSTSAVSAWEIEEDCLGRLPVTFGSFAVFFFIGMLVSQSYLDVWISWKINC